MPTAWYIGATQLSLCWKKKPQAVITAVFEDLHLTWQIYRNTLGKIRRYTLCRLLMCSIFVMKVSKSMAQYARCQWWKLYKEKYESPDLWNWTPRESLPFIDNRYQIYSSFLLSFTTFTECPFLGIEEESSDKDSRKVLYLLCNDAVYTLFPSKW